jgi:hypothetical protein
MGNHLTRSRTDQLRHFLTDPHGGLVPAPIPAADKVATPLLIHNLLHTLRSGFGQASQGIAVEVDQARLINHEPVPERGQGIMPVQGTCLI